MSWCSYFFFFLVMYGGNYFVHEEMGILANHLPIMLYSYELVNSHSSPESMTWMEINATLEVELQEISQGKAVSAPFFFFGNES